MLDLVDAVIYQVRLPDGCPTTDYAFRFCIDNHGPAPVIDMPIRIGGCGVGQVELAEVLVGEVRELLDAPGRPAVHAAPAPKKGVGGGYGPYLGTIPDFGGMGKRGVLLQGVCANSPAEKAGLRGGDRIVSFDGAAIANLEEYAALLFAARPGQRVEVIAIRNDDRMTFDVTLGQRR